MANDTVRVPVEVIQDFMVDVFKAQGVTDEDAGICAEVLITSDLRGIESHGVGRLKYYYDRIQMGVQFPTAKMEIVKDEGATALVDGNHGMGHPTAYRSMKLAMQKAKAYGVGAVAVRNTTHFGIAGYYPLMAAKARDDGLRGDERAPVDRADLQHGADAGDEPHRLRRAFGYGRTPSASTGRRPSASAARSRWRIAPRSPSRKAG